MSGTDTTGWRRTSPLAAVFYLGKIYEAIAKNAVQSLAPLAAFLVAFRGNRLAAIVGIGLFFAATVLHAFLRYWFFRYRLASDSIYIRDGVFRKRQLDIKFDRVQGINATQNVIFRLFGLVTLNLDTAGASGQEGHLPAVRGALAEDIRERIRRTPPREPVPAGDARTSAAGPDAEVLLRLKLGDVVRVGLSSGRVFLVLLLIGPLLDYFEDRLQAVAEEEALLELLGAAQPTFGTAIVLALTVVIVIFVVLMAASVIGAVLRWHGYELTAVDADVLRAHGGLLTRQEQSVHRAKVQSLYVIQNFMLRRFRRYRLRTRQATSGRAGAASRFDVPICGAETLPRIGSVLFRDELGELPLTPQAPGFAPISRAYVRARTVTHGVVPALCACALLGPAFGLAGLLTLLWIPLSTGIALRQHRRFGVAVTGDGMAFRRGFVGFRIVVWLHRKVQRVSVTQSPFQRRRGLATMKFYLAAGSVTVPFVDYAAAARLRDYVLYRVESSERAWH